MKKSLYYLLILAMTAFSCTKKDNTEPDPSQTGSCRMTSHTTPWGTKTFYYDAAKRVEKMRYVDENGDTTWENFYYESDHVKYRTISYSGYPADTVEYFFSAGRYTDEVATEDSIHYVYNSLGQIIRLEEYFYHEYVGFTEYIYDTRGNCISEILWTYYNSNYERWQWHDIEYGDKKNQLVTVGLPHVDFDDATWAMIMSPNNILKYRLHDPGGDTQVLNYSYSDFNSNGYPVSYIITDSIGSNPEPGSVEYICP